MPAITITAADGRTFKRPVDKDVLTVGRSSKNDVNLSFDLSLSRFHAEILRRDSRFFVRDVGSRNGTSLNGVAVVEPAPLKNGDRITLGETTILFGDEGPPSVVLDDTPVSRDTSTFTIPLDDIITHSAVEGVGERASGSRLRDLGSTIAPDIRGSEGRTLTILTRAGMELINHRPYEEVLEVIMDLVFEAIPAERGFLMLLEGDSTEMVSKAVRDLRKSSGGSISLSRSIANMVIQNRQAILTTDAQSDERFKMRESVVLQGIRSAMCVPLYDNKSVIGLVYVDTLNTARSFRPEDLKLLTLLANIAAMKIQNTRLEKQAIEQQRMEKELEQASDIQKRLLPGGPPTVEGYDISGRADACRSVGGDYFDFVARSDGRTGIVIGDVSGKGMAAALMMASVQAVFRTLYDIVDSPASLLTSLNRHLIRNASPNKFVSFFYGELDRETGVMRYVNAGHNPPYVVRASGQVDSLKATGVVLGIFENAKFEEREVTLQPGDLLAMFSDGVPEAQNTDGEMYGEERLIAVLTKNRDQRSAGVETSIFEELLAFAGEAPQYDDSTLVIVKRLS
ncbi:MAG: SpoIIE family protein phosphatase [Acidobacteria bacterium]|nr:SpoIIE family protein phosphatase [Acidobacteriota bacterium]